MSPKKAPSPIEATWEAILTSLKLRMLVNAPFSIVVVEVASSTAVRYSTLVKAPSRIFSTPSGILYTLPFSAPGSDVKS